MNLERVLAVLEDAEALAVVLRDLAATEARKQRAGHEN